MVALDARLHLILINLAMRIKVPLKSTPATRQYSFATNRALYLIISPNASFLLRNTHLHPTLLQSFGRIINFDVLLAMNKSYSSYITASHLLASLDLNALHKFKGSSNNVILAHPTAMLGVGCDSSTTL